MNKQPLSDRDLDWQELNLGNYNEAQVANLNQAAIEMYQIAKAAIAKATQAEEE